MSRILPCCSVGQTVLIITFVLQVIVSISLPFIPSFNIVNVKFSPPDTGNLPTVTVVTGQIKELRLGIWAYCGEVESSGDNSCIHVGHAYSVGILGHDNQLVKVHSSWTRGLVVHPVAAAATFVALIFALSPHITVLLIASLLSLLAALLTLIAFAIDIALFVLTKNAVDNLTEANADTDFGPGFWLTLVSFVLLLIASVTTCVHRRIRRRRVHVKETTGGGTTTPVAPVAAVGGKKPIWKRWKKAEGA